MLIPEASDKFVQTSTGAYTAFYVVDGNDRTHDGKPKKRQVLHNELGPARYDPRLNRGPEYFLFGRKVTLEEWAKQLCKTDEEVIWQKLHFY